MRRNKITEIGSAAAVALSICAAAIVTCAFAGESRDWPNPTFYTIVVRPGETLAGVAARYRVSVASVAKLNRIDTHGPIAAGEVLRIPAGSTFTRDAVLAEALDRTARNYAPPPKTFGGAGYIHADRVSPVHASPEHLETDVSNSGAGAFSGTFVWPLRGPVISSFGPGADGERNDGINIAAMLGAPIRAAASGTVTYAGDELKDYGNLVLIAHAGGFITAYAHAQSIAVARGDHVEKGQIIGTAGESGGVDRPQLHFEIRDGMKPLNPVRLLAALP